jgi:glycosyltransferase involved in cell wall biosynthesis
MAMPRPYFSLIHATYNSNLSLKAHFDRWVGSCSDPPSVEYIFAMEEGDRNQYELPIGFRVVVTNPAGGFSSSVLNWNTAARNAIGEILVVVSDDITPPNNWDLRIREAIGNANPLKSRFVLKVNDSGKLKDSLVSHPIISRKHYEDLGLFSPDFSGMYCDNDFTWKAFFYSTILDGRHISYSHRHPHLGSFPETSSHIRNNRDIEYKAGREAFERRWPVFIDATAARYLPLFTSISPNKLVILFTRGVALFRSSVLAYKRFSHRL